MSQIQKSITPFKQVQEFHETFGHPIKKEFQNDIFEINPKIVTFRLNLISEEIQELKDAYNATDYIEFVDALGDILYVVFGMCHVFGIDFDAIFPYDYEKDRPQINQIIVPSILILKKYFEEIKPDKQIVNFFVQLNKSFKMLSQNCSETKYLPLVAYNLVDIVKCIIDLSKYLNIDIYGAFTEIHRSNMTKVCTSETDAIVTVEHYKLNETRYESPAYRKSSNDKYWVIYDQSTTKILKSIFFELPSLNKFIGQLSLDI